jgi:hypothetical protein
MDSYWWDKYYYFSPLYKGTQPYKLHDSRFIISLLNKLKYQILFIYMQLSRDLSLFIQSLACLLVSLPKLLVSSIFSIFAEFFLNSWFRYEDQSHLTSTKYRNNYEPYYADYQQRNWSRYLPHQKEDVHLQNQVYPLGYHYPRNFYNYPIYVK